MHNTLNLNRRVILALRDFRIRAGGFIRTRHARQGQRRRVRVDIEGL